MQSATRYPREHLSQPSYTSTRSCLIISPVYSASIERPPKGRSQLSGGNVAGPLLIHFHPEARTCDDTERISDKSRPHMPSASRFTALTGLLLLLGQRLPPLHDRSSRCVSGRPHGGVPGLTTRRRRRRWCGDWSGTLCAGGTTIGGKEGRAGGDSIEGRQKDRGVSSLNIFSWLAGCLLVFGLLG
jgi:hypothetical protein